MKQLLLALSLGLALMAPAQTLTAQTSPAGHWEGTVAVPNQQLTIAVDLGKNDKGQWTGSFGVPS